MEQEVETATSSTGHRRPPMPFAARVQSILAPVLFVSLLLITQQMSKSLYQIGLPLLMLTALIQIAFGNIPPTAGFHRSLTLLILTAVIIGTVFFASIQLAPSLIGMTR